MLEYMYSKLYHLIQFLIGFRVAYISEMHSVYCRRYC